MAGPVRPPVPPRILVVRRSGGNPYVTIRPGNGSSRYLHNGEEREQTQEEADAEETQRRMAEQRAAMLSDPSRPSTVDPEVLNRDLPQRSFMSAPGSTVRPGYNDYFKYNPVPERPGDYNEEGYITADGTNRVATSTMRDRGIFFQRYYRLQSSGEPIIVATGEYYEEWVDFEVPFGLPGVGSRVLRTDARSKEKRTPPLGHCQISLFDEIFTERDGLLDLHLQSGHEVSFIRPKNFFSSRNMSCPHLSLRAPWLGRLELDGDGVVKHFEQQSDGVYRLTAIRDKNGNSYTCTRGHDGQLLRMRSPDHQELIFENDDRGRRVRVSIKPKTGVSLQLVEYRYDEKDRMVVADCAFGPSARYEWCDHSNALLSWSNATGRSVTRFLHDASGRVTETRTNGLWNGDRFLYSPEHRRTRYRPAGDARREQCFEYDAYNNVTSETNALGHVTVHRYGAAGQKVGTTDANGNSSSMEYDARGNIRRFTDAEGRTTSYIWGPLRRLDAVIDGAGNMRRYAYDERANLISETDAEERVTTYDRDERGRLMRTNFANGTSEARNYDDLGRLTSITDVAGTTTHYTYDAFGRLASEVDALGGVTRYEYGAGAGGFSVPTAITRPDGVRISRTFTADGVLADVTDGSGRTWTYRYGAFDALLSITNPAGDRMSLTYDSEGRITAVTNQRGAVYAIERDVAGQIVAEVDFDGRRTSYRRDSAGRVVETVKPDGMRLRYTFDRSDRTIAVRVHAADDVEGLYALDETHFWYDGRGLLARASNRAALVEFDRDREGRVVVETVNGRRVTSMLDACGRRIERRIGVGVVRTKYDGRGLVASVGVDGHAPLSFAYDALGREVRRASMSGFRLDQAWDAAGRLRSQSAGHGGSDLDGLAASAARAGSGTKAQRHFTWDQTGAPSRIDDLIWGDTHYEYNANGQVGEARFGDGSSERFDYDAAKDVAGVYAEDLPGASTLGRILAWQSTPGGAVRLARGPRGESVTLTHDLCGRVVERRVERRGFRPQVWRYGWDGHDRLVRCDNPAGETWFYGYDPFGRRLTKVRKLSARELSWTARHFPGLTPASARDATQIWTWPEAPEGSGGPGNDRVPIVGVQFTWDGDVVAEEGPLRLDGRMDSEAATCWHYKPGSFVPLAKQTREGELLPMVTDHLGTPREMFDERGDLRWAVAHATWGSVRGRRSLPAPVDDGRQAIYPRGGPRETSASESTRDSVVHDCPIRFQGQWEDGETGLYYNRFRYYDPLAGQYASKDPYGLLAGTRLHSYVENCNIYCDPLGLNQSNNPPRSEANPNWGGARRDYWRELGQQELENPSGRYSAFNVARMNQGKAPQFRVVVRNRKTGQEEDRTVSVELHHTYLPQRGAGAIANEGWNLTPSTPWGHESMDIYRSTGYDPVKILQGTNSFGD